MDKRHGVVGKAAGWSERNDKPFGETAGKGKVDTEEEEKSKMTMIFRGEDGSSFFRRRKSPRCRLCFDFSSYDGAKSACVWWVGGFESKLGGVVANNEAAFPLKSPQSRRINQRALWLPGRCFLSEPLSRFIRSNGAGAHVAISCRHRLSAAFVMLQRN